MYWTEWSTSIEPNFKSLVPDLLHLIHAFILLAILKNNSFNLQLAL